MTMENAICTSEVSGADSYSCTGTMRFNAGNKEPLPNEKALGPRVALLTDDMKQFGEAGQRDHHPR